MANSVNIKMGVSGISQFKQNMKQAQTSVKTLDAELSLNEKQFKASGDAQTYMEQKAELLKKKLEEQKAVVANAEKALEQMTANGVDKASKAYQDMQQQLLKAKGDLLDTEAAMNNVGEAANTAGDEASQMNQQLQRIGDGIGYQNVIEGLGSITDGIQGVITKAWKMGEALVQATLGAGSWADELATTAAQYEITPEKLQRMRKTATLIDTDAETILAAQDKLTKNREKQGKEFMGALAYLGIDPSGKNDLDLFWEAGEAIQALGKNEDKVSYAQALFGESWRELMPLFAAGRKEYEKTYDSWNVVEQDQLDALGKMDDQYQKMTQEWETFKMEMLSAFSGPLTEGMETITGLFEELNKYLDTPEGQAMIKQIGDTISGLITDLTQIDPAEVVGGLKSVIDGITGALKWIDENKMTVVSALEFILAGWAGLKLAGGALTVMNLISGIQGLTGSAAAAAGTTAGASWGAAFSSAVMKAAPFLAFLYTLLNPASSANNDLDMLWDENGNPTQAARDIGINETYDEYNNGVSTIPEWQREEEERKLQEKLATEYVQTNPEEADARNRRRINSAKQLRELQGLTDAPVDWRQQEMEARGLLEAADKLEETAEVLSGSGSGQKGTSEIAAAVTNIKDMPSLVSYAIQTAMGNMKFIMDGETVGRIVTPYVNAGMAGIVTTLTK